MERMDVEDYKDLIKSDPIARQALRLKHKAIADLAVNYEHPDPGIQDFVRDKLAILLIDVIEKSLA